MSKNVESIRVILARLEERIGNFAQDNKETHDTICIKIDKLIEHVNHENEKMDARLVVLEKSAIISVANVKMLKVVAGVISGTLLAIITFLGILAYLKII